MDESYEEIVIILALVLFILFSLFIVFENMVIILLFMQFCALFLIAHKHLPP